MAKIQKAIEEYNEQNHTQLYGSEAELICDDMINIIYWRSDNCSPVLTQGCTFEEFLNGKYPRWERQENGFWELVE